MIYLRAVSFILFDFSSVNFVEPNKTPKTSQAQTETNQIEVDNETVQLQPHTQPQLLDNSSKIGYIKTLLGATSEL